MTAPGRLGFTLTELLVVVAIMATVLAITLGSRDRWSREANVRTAAERFAAACKLARANALAEQVPYAIAINVQNKPGSSGRVLNNRSGGHWYRMVGPPRLLSGQASARNLLIAYQGSDATRHTTRLDTFPEFVEALKDTWVGPPQHLPAGKVRFLALGDTDEGARINAGMQTTANQRARGWGYARTYPRPYFGYYDSERRRLYPWGGYDPDLPTTDPWRNLAGSATVPYNYTGFFYQGDGPVIPDCTNPADVLRDVDWNNDGSISGSDPLRGPEAGYVLLANKQPRPLVSADWQDFLIVFLPDGRVSVPPFKTNRKSYQLWPSGVPSTTLPWIDALGGTDGGMPVANWTTRNNYTRVLDSSEIGHFRAHTKAWRITLAPDSPNDQDEFPTAREALASMTPMFRVEITEQGGISILRVSERDDSALAGLTVFPAAPTWWTDSANATDMAGCLRYGFLHQPYTSTGALWSATPPGLAGGAMYTPSDAVPRGRPITTFVTPRMLSDKLWWIDD